MLRAIDGLALSVAGFALSTDSAALSIVSAASSITKVVCVTSSTAQQYWIYSWTSSDNVGANKRLSDSAARSSDSANPST